MYKKYLVKFKLIKKNINYLNDLFYFLIFEDMFLLYSEFCLIKLFFKNKNMFISKINKNFFKNIDNKNLVLINNKLLLNHSYLILYFSNILFQKELIFFKILLYENNNINYINSLNKKYIKIKNLSINLRLKLLLFIYNNFIYTNKYIYHFFEFLTKYLIEYKLLVIIFFIKINFNIYIYLYDYIKSSYKK